jgi:hypothetical protein
MECSIFCDITQCSPLKVNLAFKGLHGVISQKTELCIVIIFLIIKFESEIRGRQGSDY